MTRLRIPGFWTLLLLLATGMTVTACTETSTEAGEAAPPTTPAGTDLPVDDSFLADPIWDDGKAEIAFYRVERSYNVYDEPESVSFDVGTYVVKQNFSRETMAKTTDGSGTPAFKAATFFEINSGSYQYKRNWVVNARRADLAPLKHSFSSFDWCSNLYREYASGFRFVRAAAKANRPVVIVNLGATRGDALATIRIDGRTGTVLPRLANLLGA